MSTLRPLAVIGIMIGAMVAFANAHAQTMLTGKAAVDADWTKDAPGVRHKITLEDLPPPYATKSVTNDARVIARPAGAQLQVPSGFKVEEYASGFRNPRYLVTAPNGDIFVAESSEDTIKILRDGAGSRPEIGRASCRERVFAVV